MAERPWATPEEVKEYTDYPYVKKRDDAKLKIDITRAEQYVISYTNNKFEDYETVPEQVKTAVILVAEAFAYNTALTSREMKSEQFDDYSYTVSDAGPIDISGLGLGSLLEDFCVSEAKRGVTLRMRAL